MKREVLHVDDVPMWTRFVADGQLEDGLLDAWRAAYEALEQQIGEENMRDALRSCWSRSTSSWREHLTRPTPAAPGIGLQALARSGPADRVQREGSDMPRLLENIQQQVARTVFKVKITP